jgi:hypothetical protein
MSYGNMTRWIEDAEARNFSEAAMFDRTLTIAGSRRRHLGDAIANLPSWFHSLAHDHCPLSHRAR